MSGQRFLHFSLGACLVFGLCAFAQEGGGGQGGGQSGSGAGGSTGGAGGSTGGGTGGAGGGLPGGSTGGQSPFPGGRQPGTFPGQDRFPNTMDRQMPVFLSGKVMMEDGTPPPEPVTIERMCNGGQPRPEGYTDSKGRFSIQLGNNQAMLPDASVSNANDTSDITGGRAGSGMGGFGQQRGFSERDLMGCELRASLPGHRSQIVSLTGRRLLDNPDVGTIILKRLGNVEGLTTSVTSLEAPKDAKKAYEKAIAAIKKKKVDEAQRELEKAVSLYDRYAAAWYELGSIYEFQQKADDARAAYEKALKADSRFVKPYLQLAGMAAREQKWQEVIDTTDRVLKLNPYDYPGAYFYNAVANLNTQRLDAAEKSAREGLKVDEFRRIPKLEHVLGVVLAQKNDLSGAAEHMKAYLKFVPNGNDADFVRGQLAEIEQLSSASASAPAANPAAKP
jgi:tetratricopeptide (TPR) repeat protein